MDGSEEGNEVRTFMDGFPVANNPGHFALLDDTVYDTTSGHLHDLLSLQVDVEDLKYRCLSPHPSLDGNRQKFDDAVLDVVHEAVDDRRRQDGYALASRNGLNALRRLDRECHDHA